jgi:hypothetical protein
MTYALMSIVGVSTFIALVAFAPFIITILGFVLGFFAIL